MQPKPSTPVAPEGGGPWIAAAAVLILAALGVYLWLARAPEPLKPLKPPAPAAAQEPARPAGPGAPSLPSADRPEPIETAAERFEKIHAATQAKLAKELAEIEAEAGTAPRVVSVGDPDCMILDDRVLVSGAVSNLGSASVRAKGTITLLIDGEPAESQSVDAGSVAPRGKLTYQVLFSPRRAAQGHTVAARASWDR
ncbi:MAG TPA: hypothetical protein VN783_04860 [Thermoanaerobaculia bacterium]|nr:hypothetical protein [Thermoanaerobaculia bacterium]